MLAPRILNDVSYVTLINHEIHFALQAQYLVISYVTRINHEIHFAWQAQYLVRFEVDFACSAHSK